MIDKTEVVAYAEINTGSTGFAPSRDTRRQTVYHLSRTRMNEFYAGKEIMFVGGTGLEDSMIVPEVPAGSATLRVTGSGKAYISDNLTCYVDVVERGNGFDYCESGTLNNNATEYSCSYGGVQHYAGAAFNYTAKTYYNSAVVVLYDDKVIILYNSNDKEVKRLTKKQLKEAEAAENLEEIKENSSEPCEFKRVSLGGTDVCDFELYRYLVEPKCVFAFAL